MSDLVERLRTSDIYDYANADKMCREAAARIVELETALRFATEYVGRLASTLAKKHYPDQRFELLPNLLGRIDQIDNMTCGLHRAALTGGKEKLTPKEALAEMYKEQKRLNLE